MKPSDEQCARAERRLREASTREPGQPQLLLYLADLYDLRGDYPRAVDCYRQALALDRENVVALNNLAWLLAETSDRKDEALALIEQAIARQGGRPELLDTRAVIELAKSRTDEAIRDLQQANADQPTASRYFRLSLAYQQAQDRAAARAAWQRAKALGLKPEQLHPIEQTAFRKVTSELDPH
jgi:tetratricopeptide (TPR) repeat protein